jgi:hypothetical protein
MSDGERLADLMGSEAVEVPTIDTPGEIDLETCELLGAKVKAGGTLVPPVTTGTIALLDQIDSPFVTGEPAGLQDLFAALYVLHAKDAALEGVFVAARTRRAIERMAPAALKAGGEATDSMFANLHATAMGLARFDRDVARFAQGLGVIDVEAVTAELREHLNRSISGLRLFPESDKPPEKKTAGPSTLNGWLGCLSRCARWPVSTLRRCCGAGHSSARRTS